MELQILESTHSSVRAGYTCPCGCQPSVSYERAGATVHEGCCCGNEFAVGPQHTTTLGEKAGYRQEATSFDAPWGETISAAWLIGPSVHADAPHAHEHSDADGAAPSHDPGSEHGSSTTAIDPVCGMTVETATAQAKGLHSDYDGRDFFFCGRGCKLDFDEDPNRYLDPSHIPSM